MDTPNPATSVVVAALGAVRSAVGSVADILQRIEKRQSPGIFRVTPTGSLVGPGRPATHERLRVLSWVVTASAAGQYLLMAGESVIAAVQMSAAGTVVIPLPITIESGILVTTDGAAVVDSFLVTYTE